MPDEPGPHFPSGSNTAELLEDPPEEVDAGPHFPSASNPIELNEDPPEEVDAGPHYPSGMAAQPPEEDAAAPVPMQAAEDAETEEVEEFDPNDYTIDEVLAYVDDNPDELDAVIAAEKAGKSRVTLLSQLESR
jgi:hypothetical protein